MCPRGWPNSTNAATQFAQTLGYLGILAGAAGTAIYSSLHWPWYLTALLVFVNGHFWHFLINGFHELIHDTVFRTVWLNGFFLRIFSFLGWYNHHHFWASHRAPQVHPAPARRPGGGAASQGGYQGSGSGDRQLTNTPTTCQGQVRNFTGYLNTGDRWTGMLFPASDPSAAPTAHIRWGTC
jgi:fatty acid desaturase